MHPQRLDGMLATTSLTCSLHLLPSSVASEQNQIGQKVTFFLLQEMRCRSLPGGPCLCDVEVRVPLSQPFVARLEVFRYESPKHDFLFTL